MQDHTGEDQQEMYASCRSSGTIHETIRKIADITPDATALIHDQVPTTYRQLNQLADLYAAELSELGGIGPGTFLPVCLPRSVRLVGVILAALKLGAAYTLIDPAWPSKRIQDELNQLQSSVLVTDSDAPKDVQTRRWSPRVLEPEEVTRSLAMKETPRIPEVRPDDPCCVFFTSGTSGQPKGVISPHSGTMRIADLSFFASLGSKPVMAQASALPWDAFSLELWTPLLVGGTSILVNEPFLSSTLLRQLITEHGKNTAFLTTALFNMLVDEDLDCFSGLQTVLTGGEKLSPLRVRTFLKAHPDIALINCYGPVEATIFVSTHRIRLQDCDIESGIPIGVPCPRTGVFIMRDDQECVDGEVGELCVVGSGLAIGYLGDPELTESKFPTLRLHGQQNRVYRTGDLAFRDHTGILHFRGRVDRQLKIRGHRIEPSDIETILGAHPGVARAAILPRYSADGSAIGLAAFYTSKDEHAIADSQIDDYLRARLAAYQIPDIYIHRASIPLTTHGKLDLKALGADLLAMGAANIAHPKQEERDELSDYDPTQRTVVEVINSILPQASSAMLDATFTELGATSLDAGRICVRLSRALGRPVPISQIFRTVTARTLAEWVRETMPLSAEANETPVGKDAALLSSLQTQMLVEHLMEPDGGFSHCMIGWQIEGRLERDILSAALERVHYRHGMLSGIFEISKVPQIRPFSQPVPPLRVIVADTLHEGLEVLDNELGRPFRLTAGRVWHPVYVEIRSEPVSLLGIAVHHAVFDGVSSFVLGSDLAATYDSIRDDSPVNLAPTPSPSEIATIRESHLRYIDLDAQRTYWTSTLADIKVLEYPVNDDLVPDQNVRSRRVEKAIDQKLADAVKELAAAHTATRFAVYFAAYTQALAKLAGQSGFGVGVPFNHRNEASLSHAVGCMIEMVCVRASIVPESSPAEAIAEAVRASSAAFAAQDVPISELITYPTQRPPVGRPPLFQSIFALQDGYAPLPLRGMRSTPFLPMVSDLPSELGFELYPISSGALNVVASYRPNRVSGRFVHDLVNEFISLLTLYVVPSRAPGPAGRC